MLTQDRILVAVRVRPSWPSELKEKKKKRKRASGPRLPADFEVDLEHKMVIQPSFESTPSKSYKFDEVLPPTIDQNSTFQMLGSQLCNLVLKGYNGTLLVYGQTGSGKTYSMFGPMSEWKKKIEADKPMPNLGLIPRCVDYLLNTNLNSEEVLNTTITAQAVEIYNEKLKDLIKGSGGPPLRVVFTDDGMQIMAGGYKSKEKKVQGELSTVTIYSLTDMLDLVIKPVIANRTVSATEMNQVSSRSHCIIILTCKQTYQNGEIRESKLYFGDLAGTERVEHPDKTRFREKNLINKSLTTLRTIIKMLNRNRPVGGQYRDSMLTKILKENLVDRNSKTTVLVCCSVLGKYRHETISALNFGQSCRYVTSKAKVIRRLTSAQMKRMIKDLQDTTEKLQKDIVACRQEYELKLKNMLADNSTSKATKEALEEIASLRAKLEETSKNAAGEQEQKVLLETQILKLKDELNKMGVINNRYKNVEKHNKELEEKLKASLDENEIMMEKITSMSEARHLLKQEDELNKMGVIDNRFKNVEKDNKELEDKLKATLDENEIMMEKLTSISEAKHLLKRERESLDNEIALQKKEIEMLKHKLECMSRQEIRMKWQLSDRKDMNRKRKAQSENIVQALREVTNLQKHSIKELRTILKVKNEQVAELNKSRAMYKRSYKETKDLLNSERLEKERFQFRQQQLLKKYQELQKSAIEKENEFYLKLREQEQEQARVEDSSIWRWYSYR